MFFPFRKTRTLGAMALGRTGSSVIAVAMEQAGDKPRLVSCATYPLPENTSEVWQALTKEAHLDRYSCRLLLSSNEYQLMQVDAPNVPEAEVKQAIRWKLKDMLNYAVDQATVDAVNIPPDPNGTRGNYKYAVASRNEVIKRYMDNFDAIGADLDVIDIPEMAQRNISALLEEDGRGIALLSFTDEGGLLTFCAGGELYLARQIELNALQLNSPDEMQRAANLDRLVLELQRSLDNFERQFSYVAVNKLVIAPMSGQAALEEYLRENLYIKVSSLDLAEVVNLAAMEELENPAEQAKYFLAIGAALRQEAAA